MHSSDTVHPDRINNTGGINNFTIKRPLLWLWIAAAVLYSPTFLFGYTDLDDFLLILRSDNFNNHLSSILTSFHREVFHIASGHYYRPLFLDTVVLNYQVNGKNPMGYHVVNVLFHATAVMLLYLLFLKLRVNPLHAFILSLLFAVHPVLSQAVAWIPGRNDTLLAIFTFSFLIKSVDYTENGHTRSLLLSGFFLLLAYFTKETTVVLAPIALIINMYVIGRKWQEKRFIAQYAVWITCFLVWYVVRASVHLKEMPLLTIQTLKETVYRLPLIIQYIGKIFFPFNLSVFPALKNTTYYYGIAAALLLVVSLILSPKRSKALSFAAMGVFFLFLLPVLILPHAMSIQTFEHRLYLPITGILLLLPQTILFNNRLSEKQLLFCFMAVAGIFAGINLCHQRSFASPEAFWSQAVKTNPHSAHALMELASKERDPAASYNHFERAYRANPNEKFLNFCRAAKLQQEDSVLASEPYLIAELRMTAYYECYYYMARVDAQKGDIAAALACLKAYIKNNPNNTGAPQNVLLDNPLWLHPAQARNKSSRIIQGCIVTDILKRMGI